MKRIRVGIIGQGRSGAGIHAAYLRDDRKYAIVAIADPLAERRTRAEAEFDCEAHADVKALLKRDDLDLIVNASPSQLHVPLSLQAFRAGFNVVCEKPLACKAREVDRLIAAAKKARRRLFVFQQNRFNPGFQRMLKVMESGVLGRILQVSIASVGFGRRWDWQTLTDFNGGSLLNTGPHLMDQALQVFGTKTMPDVACHMDRGATFGNAEDHVIVSLRGKRRPLVTVEISSCCPYGVDAFRVYGACGGLTGGASRLEWKFYKPREAPKQKLTRRPIVNAEGQPSYCREQLKWHERSWALDRNKSEYTAPTATFYKLLYKSLTTRAAFPIKPEDIRQQMAVMELCRKQNPDIWG